VLVICPIPDQKSMLEIFANNSIENVTLVKCCFKMTRRKDNFVLCCREHAQHAMVALLKL